MTSLPLTPYWTPDEAKPLNPDIPQPRRSKPRLMPTVTKSWPNCRRLPSFASSNPTTVIQSTPNDTSSCVCEAVMQVSMTSYGNSRERFLRVFRTPNAPPYYSQGVRLFLWRPFRVVHHDRTSLRSSAVCLDQVSTAIVINAHFAGDFPGSQGHWSITSPFQPSANALSQSVG